jgi:hypothetical protein
MITQAIVKAKVPAAQEANATIINSGLPVEKAWPETLRVTGINAKPLKNNIHMAMLSIVLKTGDITTPPYS